MRGNVPRRGFTRLVSKAFGRKEWVDGSSDGKVRQSAVLFAAKRSERGMAHDHDSARPL
jgi:hypothetical protein